MSKLPLSQSRVAGDFVFLSGQLPFDADGKLSDTIEGQTRQCLANVASRLAEHGLTLANVVKSTVWVTATEHLPGYNVAYAESFTNDAPPCRSTVISGLVAPGCLIEIECLAYRG
jgi:2-iminobutanoate/2-iminopropanoate deaminase